MSSVSSLNSLLSSTSSSNASSIDLSSLLAASTGASSVGIDVTSAVDAAIYAARAPERVWQAQQTTLQSQTSALSSLQTALASVSSDLDTLNDLGGVLAAKTVTSSDSTTVTASVTASASAGSHSLRIQNVALAASWYSTPLSSADASLGASVFQITLGDGTQTSFPLGTTGLASLSALASSINAAGLGIDATVVSDKIGSRLSLTSQETGSSNNFSVSDNASSGAAWTSASVATASSALAGGEFQVSDGSQAATFTVPTGGSLDSVAGQINNAGLDLVANVVTDSNGAHLEIQSNGGTVTVSTDPTLGFTQASTGIDANLEVDGVPLVSSSNVVTGAIPGVTLNLQGPTTNGPVSLQVSADSSKISSALSQFVTDYNSALTLVNSQFTYSSTTSSQGVLGSDPALRSLQTALLGLTAYVPSDASSTAPAVSSLASLGITVGDDGSLSLDSTQLNQVLSTNASAVQNFFSGNSLNGFAASAQTQLKVFTESGSGVLASDVNSLNQEYTDLQTHISDFESGYIASQQTLLTSMYSKAEAALQQLPTTLKQIQAQLSDGSGS